MEDTDVTELWQSNGTIHILHDDKVVQVTRYYALHGNRRAWAIQCKAYIREHKNLRAAITYCKEMIADEKKYVEPSHGLTYYV